MLSCECQKAAALKRELRVLVSIQREEAFEARRCPLRVSRLLCTGPIGPRGLYHGTGAHVARETQRQGQVLGRLKPGLEDFVIFGEGASLLE